jgi:hypothetical protein
MSDGAKRGRIRRKPRRVRRPARQRGSPPYWTVEKFRSWIESRPEEERWELIDGAAILMTPPTLAHQRIALNLQHLLNDALEQHDPSLVALERPGLNIQPEVTNYSPSRMSRWSMRIRGGRALCAPVPSCCRGRVCERQSQGAGGRRDLGGKEARRLSQTSELPRRARHRAGPLRGSRRPAQRERLDKPHAPKPRRYPRASVLRPFLPRGGSVHGHSRPETCIAVSTAEAACPLSKLNPACPTRIMPIAC